MRVIVGSVLFFLFVTGLISCSKNVEYTQYQSMDENTGWAKNNVLKFDFEAKDTNQAYNVFINVRNAENYPFRNLFMFLHTTYPNGTKVTDTIECILADEKGKWLGSGMGDLYDNSILFKKNARFRQLGKYNFAFEQAMRFGDKNTLDPLPYIKDVGITIEKSTE
ncbi:MAG TPA: gliding motility lipoprotein GldH [Bacteroidia bacterium]|nr:gliding motility lipoprotein GldH [Bacteroidia bacterium]